MNSNRTQIRRPGDFSLLDVEVNTPLITQKLSLREILTEINLFEGVFQNCVSGYIVIQDTQNFFSSYPIVGYETITFIFGNPSDPEQEEVKYGFNIYSVTDYYPLRERVVEYKINFISAEFLSNLQTKVSRSFPGRSIDEVASTIFNSELGSDSDFLVSKTEHVHDFVIPNWSPFQALNWLASRAVSEHEGGAMFMFYGTLDSFRFISLEGQAEKPVEETYVYREKNVKSPEAPSGQPDDEQYAVVKEYQIDNTFDLINNVSLGMYSNKLVTHDIVKRKYEVFEWDYSNTFLEYKHVEPNVKMKAESQNNVTRLTHPQLPDRTLIYDSYHMLIPTHYQLHGVEAIPGRNTIGHERSIQSRVSQLQQINTFKLTITVGGDMKRRAGDVVYFWYPKAQVMATPKIEEDLLYSGRYLVLSVRHIFTKNEHETILELAKDTYFTPLPRLAS